MGRKLIDLTGREFGYLTVIKRVQNNKQGRPMWLCQCKCKKTTIVSSTSLLRPNGTRSCGCLRHKASPAAIDLSGQHFGLLTVLHKDKPTKSGKAKWVCRCKCGNTVSVLSESLRKHVTTSCGCRREALKEDLTGMEFGFLSVIEPVWHKGNETRWKCLCKNCGRTVEVDSYWLRNSNPYGHCSCTRFTEIWTDSKAP